MCRRPPRRPESPPPGEDEEWALFYSIAWLVWLNYMSGRYAEAGALAERHKAVWRRAKNPVLAMLGRCYDPFTPC
ncbi:hypothetical protein J2Z21_008852 [Streptomyces griseochromogenes]|uniref:Uncharacterized protein n=1 Tax=Streptomyces griseochromogenes TaxID=68214 RepID=A0A1B1AZ26_9ACTN|nr:hypothetical protein [Streptomyces griseochromogenes]ANP51790.1 hypothetical protein AVL59_21320 [Streptomyces griseochromogenes]MBP2055836.1 hypothetical protein [Streptomyces griseochromogenes]